MAPQAMPVRIRPASVMVRCQVGDGDEGELTDVGELVRGRDHDDSTDEEDDDIRLKGPFATDLFSDYAVC